MRKSQKSLLTALVLMAMCGTVGCGGSKTSSKPAATSSNVTSSVVTSSSAKESTSSSKTDEVVAVDLLASVSDGGDGAYTVSSSEGKTTVTYNKAEGQEWAAATVDLKTVSGLASMSTLKFKISGSGSVIMKIQGSQGAVEINLVLSATVGAYEWNLIPDNAVLQGAETLYFFGAPGAASEGSFVLEELTLTPETADNFIINSGYTNVSASSNTYDGVSSTFSFNANWIDNDQVIYEFTEADGKTVVDYNKGAYDWAFAYAEISGQYGKFPYITLKVQGTKGDSVIFKVQPKDVAATELKIEFTGETQVVTMDLSNYTEEQRQSISRVLFFAAPGVKEASGSFTIEAAYFTMDYEGEKPVVHETNIYNGTDEQFGCNAYWYDNGDGAYEVVEGSMPVEVNYNKSAEWSSLKTQVSGALGNFTKLKFGVEIAEGKELLIKTGNKEVKIVGTGSYDDSHEIDLSELTINERNAIREVLIFAEPGLSGVSGSFKIHWMSFQGFVQQKAETSVFTGAGRFFNVNRNFQDNGDGIYGVTTADGKTSVSYDKKAGQEWGCMIENVQGEFGVFDALTYTVTIPEGQSILLKVEGNGAKEITIAGTGSAQTGIFDLSSMSVEQRNGISKIVVFADPGTAPSTGSFEINSLQFSHRRAATIGETGVVDHSSASWFDLGDDVYTLSREETGVRVSYSEAKGDWACAGLRITSNAGYSKVVVKVKGVANETVLIKMENDDNAGACKETGIVSFDGASQEFELDISNIMATNPETLLLVLFGNPANHGTASSFVVEEITFKA